ncbi:MAG: vanadium-dependent haloperoxidase, partial [Saprospiraceae bacterium]
IVDRSVAFGKKVADVVYDYSKGDGGHEAYLEPFQKPYAIPTDAYCWVPTGSVKDPLSPRWGNNRPFMDVNVEKTKVPMPVVFSESKDSEFYREAIATYNQVKNNTTEQVEIAKYWSDDPFATCTPAGHTFNILTQILFEEKATLAKTSVAIARLGIAENDAFIACWKGKYDHVLLRPVTYINRHIDPAWKTILGTPPFPAYTSGHSCEMGAGSRVLSAMFTKGDGNFQFTDYSQLKYGFYARSFSNFDVMAEECANSRLYGGIHYPMDNSKGLQLGRAIGDNVNKRLKWPVFVR